jgi:hypothetical protein
MLNDFLEEYSALFSGLDRALSKVVEMYVVQFGET